MGDPSGIGPEIILKALAILPDHQHSYIVYGHRPSFAIAGIEEISLERQFFEFVSRIEEVQKPGKYFIETTPPTESIGEMGNGTEQSGKASIDALEEATRDLLDRLSDTLVTAPISKKATNDAGFGFPGHTEYLANHSGSEQVMMIMVHQKLRVALQTIHIPLSKVSQQMSSQKLLSTIRFLHETLARDFNEEHPVIDILGINPHAGDQGVLGSEEIEFILPAIAEAKNMGIIIEGPHSADAYFARKAWKKADAVLAMYHDQGLIPFKMLDQGAGVNVTAGLPFVRTSPDHGTAFDIASKGVASAKSMLMAIQLAVTLSDNRLKHSLI